MQKDKALIEKLETSPALQTFAFQLALNQLIKRHEDLYKAAGRNQFAKIDDKT